MLRGLGGHASRVHLALLFVQVIPVEVQIDSTVIRAGGHEVVEIFTGCLCLMRDDLYLGLADLAPIEGLEWVIIEPSGMADATRLTRLLERFPRAIDPIVATRYRLQTRLSLVDAARYRLLMRSVRQLVSWQKMLTLF